MIGVFDSGHGGLTVLRALVDRFPQRSFLYYGDHAHIPYGDRTSAEIVTFTRAAMDLLFTHGCRLVILACNTAAAVALRTLQQEWLPKHYPDRRILGVLVPTVEAITGVPWLADVTAGQRAGQPRTIAVFATRRTVASNAYPEEIVKRAPEVTVVQHACVGLVDMIERNASRAELRSAIAEHVAALTKVLAGRPLDAVMLGCTHYPLVADMFAAALPRGVDILSQPDLVARSLGAYLERRPAFDTPDGQRTIRFLTSGDAEQASVFASLYFGRDARFETEGLPSD
ncbi:MAG: glutamate racemase [Rhodospirillaceae bacterium]|nr:MAG: glutamate racemase [Rhodospirillaceae bacterium]